MSDPNQPASEGSWPQQPTGPEAEVPPAPDVPAGPQYVDLSAPSYAEPYPAASRSRGKRGVIIGAVAAGTVAVLGGSAFAAWWFLSGGGPQPEEALPDSTIAVISIDLDPSAGQKIEAIKTLRKFPAFSDELDIDSRDDLREFIFEKALGGDCKNLSYDDDLKPWIGERAALAAVDLGRRTPAPAVVLAIKDKDKARTGIESVIDCALDDRDDDEPGFAIGEEFVVFSDTQKHADQILADGKAKPLADDKDYQRITDKVDDPGVVNFYVSQDAGDFLADAFADFEDELGGPILSEDVDDEASEGVQGEMSLETAAARAGAAGRSAPAADACNPADYYEDQFDTFGGLAGTVRFDDGGVELEAIGIGLVTSAGSSATVGTQIQNLPADSAIALGYAGLGATVEELFDVFESCDAQLVDEIEDATGLSVPDDIKTLLGSSLTLSVGESFPEDLADIEGFADIPVGLVINGDGDEIEELIDKLDRKLQAAEGVSLDDLDIEVVSLGDRVIITPSNEYGDALSEDGSLGDSGNFKDVVPETDKANYILYLNFESKIKDAIYELAEDEGEDPDDIAEVRENLDPLKSFGLSTWTDGDEGHFVLKIATD